MCGKFGHHEFDDTVGCLRIATHEVERDTVLTPRCERQHRDRQPVDDSLDEQAVRVERITQSSECHREAAFVVGVAPGVGETDDVGHLDGTDIVVSSNPHGDTMFTRPVDCLPNGLHIVSGEREVLGVQDGFVAELKYRQPRAVIRLRAVLARTHYGRCPSVRASEFEPFVDRVWPRFAVADRVAGGQAHADLDTIGHRGLAARCEHDRLVASGREVSERVVAVSLEESPNG